MLHVIVLEAQSLVIRYARILTMENDEILGNLTVNVENGAIPWVDNAVDAEIPDKDTVITGHERPC